MEWKNAEYQEADAKRLSEWFLHVMIKDRLAMPENQLVDSENVMDITHRVFIHLCTDTVTDFLEDLCTMFWDRLCELPIKEGDTFDGHKINPENFEIKGSFENKVRFGIDFFTESVQADITDLPWGLCFGLTPLAVYHMMDQTEAMIREMSAAKLKKVRDRTDIPWTKRKEKAV